MCDVICTVGLLHVALLVHTVRCVDFQVQMLSFDVKLLGNEQKGHNSIHLRAVQDSLEDPNGEGTLHLRAIEDSAESAQIFRVRMGEPGKAMENKVPIMVHKVPIMEHKNPIKEHKVPIMEHKVPIMEHKVPIIKTTNSSPMNKRPTKVNTDCFYHYPEKREMDILLSNMMNELTQVFVKSNEWLKEKITRRTRQLHNADDIRRALETRFRVSHRKQKDFFEDIYHNMTINYKAFYNWTAKRVMRSGRDACEHQNEVKNIWQDLLERSLVTLKKAIRHCVDEYLKDQNIDPDSKLGSRVNEHLLKEMSVIRTNQLKLICERFQLCYDEILQEFRWKTNLRADEFRRTEPWDYK